jgi:DNA-nicking Smr family endonuclease
MIRKTPDFELWAEVAKSIDPLHRSGKKAPSDAKRPAAKVGPMAMVKPRMAKTPPPITGFDRRTTQKFTRGKVEIDARLDLHGTGIEMARVRLLQFLIRSHEQGARTALVITGKGDSPYARHTLHGAGHFHAPERQGRLRRLVPEWLHEAEFRALVSGFQPAHPKHGGGGAFYVRLRRNRA